MLTSKSCIIDEINHIWHEDLKRTRFCIDLCRLLGRCLTSRKPTRYSSILRITQKKRSTVIIIFTSHLSQRYRDLGPRNVEKIRWERSESRVPRLLRHRNAKNWVTMWSRSLPTPAAGVCAEPAWPSFTPVAHLPRSRPARTFCQITIWQFLLRSRIRTTQLMAASRLWIILHQVIFKLNLQNSFFYIFELAI